MKQLIIFAILMPAAVAAEMKLPAALQQAVPPGWAATHYASGDLNGDQRADAALMCSTPIRAACWCWCVKTKATACWRKRKRIFCRRKARPMRLAWRIL